MNHLQKDILNTLPLTNYHFFVIPNKKELANTREICFQQEE